MKLTWRTEGVQWLLLLAMFVLAAITWTHAPDPEKVSPAGTQPANE